MTGTLLQDFNKRSKEVSKYFIFLKNLEQGNIKLIMEGMDGKTKTRTIDTELEKTLKASGFLLLYNLIESTMRNAIEAIFDDIRKEGVSFDQVSVELKKVVLSNLKKRNPDKLLSAITAISLDIIAAGFDKQDLFSGNIDAKLIKKLADEYGFSHKTDPTRTGNGNDLLTIKSNRNDLAHGIKSFGEVGRDKSAEELLEIKNKVLKYLKQILINIEIYLNNKEYLHRKKL
ncbi:MAE_28990/MAE_18760 family HEPN-like nuclease [Nostoc sp. MG11]|uniref:MAE_28990/MAE_18760 family HEPN-like nuclease n=1 Tax=Nostoc sp. MG11 TaxID=2721166 RepID=UPI00186877CF|nr:MAE_28990/MAE_18760 family HEPN-like nuclease [Nostoc sp. MG11]